MHSKLSSEKKSISMNLGSIIEREEKRFVYRVRCSSDENNKEEEMEEGIRNSQVVLLLESEASLHQSDFAPYVSGSYNVQWNAPELLHDKHMLHSSCILRKIEQTGFVADLGVAFVDDWVFLADRLIRQVCEALIFICSLSQSAGLVSQLLSATLLWLSARKNLEEG
ncbi:hypothetical protein GmHk_16G046252 [Glycine max]|nr:hypothetical protein GmHk_16G046252 [Glycine max]